MSVEADVWTDLTDTYTSRVRADLDRVDSEIAKAEQRLESLTANRALLGKLWEDLTAASRTGSGGTDSHESASHGVRTAQRRGAHAPTAADTVKKGPKANRGAVRDAVLRRLEEHSSPMSVKEMFESLQATEPVQPAGKVVVRNTLEALVAKGIAERSRKGQSIYYTLVASQSELRPAEA